LDSSILSITKVEVIDDFLSKNNLQTTKQTLFEHVPPFFIISFKRFVYDIRKNQTQKVLKHINITETLEIPSVVMTSKNSVVYRLFAGIL
jgi:hypothetical protein